MSARAAIRGFTLVEILVALALLALTALLAYRATAALVDGETLVLGESARWRGYDAVFARLEADLRQAQPRPVRTANGVEPPWNAAPEAGGNSALVFSRAGPEFTADPGVAGQRIGYRVRNGALEVVYWPRFDNGSHDAAKAYRLIDDVAAFRVEHLANTGEWIPRWPRFGEADLPRAVRVSLTLASGETLERWFALR